MYEPLEFNIEEMEEREAIENAKDYNTPDIGDVVTVKFLSGKEEFIVIRKDYAVNHVYGEDIKSKHPVYITGWNYRKSIKHQRSFHVCHVTSIKRRPKEYLDKNYVDDWQQHVSRMIESQIPVIGKTAVVLPDSILNIFEKRHGESMRTKLKYKIVDIRERDIAPLLILKRTKHFNGKFEELDLGHCYIT